MLPAPVDEQVRGLEVAVQDAILMAVGQTAQQLLHDALDLCKATIHTEQSQMQLVRVIGEPHMTGGTTTVLADSQDACTYRWHHPCCQHRSGFGASNKPAGTSAQ